MQPTILADAQLIDVLKWVIAVPHGIAAVLAMLLGLLAFLTHNNGQLHLPLGRSYVWMMGIVAVTALPLTYYRPNAALLELTVLSFILAFTGPRWFKPHLPKTTFTIDGLLRIVLILSAFPAAYFGVQDINGGETTQGVATLLLAATALGVGVVESAWRKPLPLSDALIRIHINHMLGSYALILTVGLVLGAPWLPGVVRWFTFPAIGLGMMVYYRIRTPNF